MSFCRTCAPESGGGRGYVAAMALRVVVAEDHVLVREGLIRLIDAQDDMTVVGVAEDIDGLMSLCDSERPDVVVTDIRMPPTGTDEGIRAASQLRDLLPDAGVVVLSQFASPAYALTLFERGSERRAYLLKERLADAGELARAIREVASGGSVVDAKVVDELVTRRASNGAADLDRLTPREGEVLASMAQGRSNAAIAAELVLSERAVEKHSNSIFSKLGLTEEPDVNRRVKAVLLFLAQRGG